MDLATGEYRQTYHNREMFRKEVILESSEGKILILTPDDIEVFTRIVQVAMQISSEEGEPESNRSRINELYLKITGRTGRKIDLPDDVIIDKRLPIAVVVDSHGDFLDYVKHLGKPDEKYHEVSKHEDCRGMVFKDVIWDSGYTELYDAAKSRIR